MDEQHAKDLFWHALNYRSTFMAHDQGLAQRQWLELVACVNRLIADGVPIDDEGEQVAGDSQTALEGILSDYEAIARKTNRVHCFNPLGAEQIKSIIEAYEAQKARPEWVPLDLEKVKQGQEVRGKCWIGATAANFVAVYNGNIIVEQKGVGFTQHMNEGDNWLMRAPRPKTVHVRVFKMPDGEYVSTAGRFFDGYQVVGEGDIEVLE